MRNDQTTPPGRPEGPQPDGRPPGRRPFQMYRILRTLGILLAVAGAYRAIRGGEGGYDSLQGVGMLAIGLVFVFGSVALWYVQRR